MTRSLVQTEKMQIGVFSDTILLDPFVKDAYGESTSEIHVPY